MSLGTCTVYPPELHVVDQGRSHDRFDGEALTVLVAAISTATGSARVAAGRSGLNRVAEKTNRYLAPRRTFDGEIVEYRKMKKKLPVGELPMAAPATTGNAIFGMTVKPIPASRDLRIGRTTPVDARSPR